MGSRLRLRMQPVGAPAVTLKPTVVHVVEGACLRWRGTLRIPGLLDAEHEFRVTERSGGSTLHQDQQFRGLLVPAVMTSLHRQTLPAFLAMNRALELRAEQVGTVAHG